MDRELDILVYPDYIYQEPPNPLRLDFASDTSDLGPTRPPITLLFGSIPYRIYIGNLYPNYHPISVSLFNSPLDLPLLVKLLLHLMKRIWEL